MSNMKKTVLAVALSAAMSPLAHAELTANIGATSNYMWRGMTQTNNGSAISGGIDYADDSGFYVGTWASNVSFADYEWDLYGGIGGETNGFTWDVNTIYYVYDDDCGDCNFWELGGSLGYQWFTFGAQYTIDGEQPDNMAFSEGDFYYYANASFDLEPTWTLGLTLGRYEFDTNLPGGNDDDLDYTHWQADIGKSVGDFGDLTFSLGGVMDDNNNTYDDDVKVFVSWGKSF